MKKFIATIAGVLLCGAFALSACEGRNEPQGEIKGNYVEVTSTELTEKLEKITPDKLLGDTSSEDWKFGFEFTSDSRLEADIKTTKGEETEPFIKLNIDEESTLKAMFEATEDETAFGGLSVKMQNNNKLEGKIEKSDILEIEEDINFDYSINLHADDEYLYFQIPDMSDLPLPFEISEGKFKVPVKYLFSAVENLLPNTMSRAAEGDTSGVADFLTEYSLKAYVDESDGLKVKISADKQALYTMLDKIAGIPAETAEGFATFNTFAVDLYFETAADGKFERAGLTADIDGTLNIKAGDLGDGVPALCGPVKIKADVTVKRFSGEIIMPTAEQLEEYIDITDQNGENGNE